MQINLDAGMTKQPGEEISCVKGCFYAFVADSLAYVDVPFKQSDDWVRLTPDMEIRLPGPWCKESQYRLQIRARPEESGSMAPFHVHGYLPDRLLVERRVLGPDDKLIDHPTAIRGLPRSITDECAVYGGKGLGRIKKVRFVIAVNLRHRKIPFVLENIPLPKF